MVARADDPVNISVVIANWAGILAVPRYLEFAFVFFLNDWETIAIFFDITDVSCSCLVFFCRFKITNASFCVLDFIADFIIISSLFNVLNLGNLRADVPK